MLRKVFIGFMISCFFAASFLSYSAFAEEAVILFMQGDVKIREAGLTAWAGAKQGMSLSSGDKLKTGSDSWAEIGLGKGYGNVVRVQEWTLLELTDLDPIDINLLEGELRALVENLSTDETFEIRTSMSICGVRGTGWDTATDGTKVIVDAFEKSVFFAGVSQAGAIMADAILKAGKRGTLTDPKKPITIKNVPVSKLRDWKKWKRDFLQRTGRGKAGGAGQSQKGLQNMIKGKERIFERGDQDFIDNKRLQGGPEGTS